MSQALVGLDLPEIQDALGAGQPAFRGRQVYQALYQQKVENLNEISTLPATLRQSLAERFSIGLPKAESWFDSADGTRRYLLQLEDGRTVETVLMPEAGSQYDLHFLPGRVSRRLPVLPHREDGLERNLTAGEIVGQILLVAARHGLSPTDTQLNVVMMGMGEPLLNLPNVLKASRILFDPAGVGMSPRRMTVSTAGIIPRIAEFAREPMRPKLAISLNASHEEQRQELMPITKNGTSKILSRCAGRIRCVHGKS